MSSARSTTLPAATKQTIATGSSSGISISAARSQSAAGGGSGRPSGGGSGGGARTGGGGASATTGGRPPALRSASVGRHMGTFDTPRGFGDEGLTEERELAIELDSVKRERERLLEAIAHVKGSAGVLS